MIIYRLDQVEVVDLTQESDHHEDEDEAIQGRGASSASTTASTDTGGEASPRSPKPGPSGLKE